VVVVAAGGCSGGDGSNQGVTRAVCETGTAARRRRNNAQTGGKSRKSAANHANDTGFALKSPKSHNNSQVQITPTNPGWFGACKSPLIYVIQACDSRDFFR
jgi:hypothetical protein